MADRAFDGHGVFHVLDQKHDVNYLIPKKTDSKRLRADANKVREDSGLKLPVEQDASLYVGMVQRISTWNLMRRWVRTGTVTT
jgi:hypothetical protein